MLKKIKAGWTALERGKEVADPALWKSRQVTGNAMGAFILALVALAKAFEIEVPIDEEAALLIGGGIVAAFNVVLTVATSRKVGMSPGVHAEPEVPDHQRDQHQG